MSANLGPVRPPLVYLGSILLGLLLHFAWPLPLVRHPVSALIGAGVVLMAVGLFITAVRTFRAAGTPVPGNRPTTTFAASISAAWTGEVEDLGDADLRDADLTEADLRGAIITDQQLAQCKSLKGATMPDGSKHK
jgi:uncharacterized protein YjbI with pentapeptide repeats